MRVALAEAELSPTVWPTLIQQQLCTFRQTLFLVRRWCIDTTAFTKRSLDNKCILDFEGGNIYCWAELMRFKCSLFSSKSAFHPSHSVNAQGVWAEGTWCRRLPTSPRGSLNYPVLLHLHLRVCFIGALTSSHFPPVPEEGVSPGRQGVWACWTLNRYSCDFARPLPMWGAVLQLAKNIKLAI